jgi:hypothetical protein
MTHVTVHHTQTLEKALKDSSQDPLDLFHDKGFSKSYSLRDEQTVNVTYVLREQGDIDTHFLKLDVITYGKKDFLAKIGVATQTQIHHVPDSRVLLDIRYDDREVFSQQTMLTCYKNLPLDPRVPLYDAFELRFDDGGLLSRVQVVSYSPRHHYISPRFDALVQKGKGIMSRHSKDADMFEIIKGFTSQDFSRFLDAKATITEILALTAKNAPIDVCASLVIK